MASPITVCFHPILSYAVDGEAKEIQKEQSLGFSSDVCVVIKFNYCGKDRKMTLHSPIQFSVMCLHAIP